MGRFISKDSYAGSLSDPYSQHSYQYAHANPVRYTDPTGYSTLMGEVLATLDLMARLSVVGSGSFAAGYIIGAAASGEDIFPLVGEFAVGFAGGVSGGFLTDVYEAGTGTKIEPKHALLYQAGNVAGIGVSFITGLQAVTWAKAITGPQKWVAGTLIGLDIYGAGKATNNLYQSYQHNGAFEREDLWNLLAYVPLLGAAGGIKKFFAANKAAQADDVVKGAVSNTCTKAGNCFVAGTEILTIDGIKNIEEIEVGDWVVADDPNTVGEIEYKQVTDTFVRHTDKLVDLYIDGQIISTTGEHPFWTPDKGWVNAKDLVVGSLVQTEDGRVIDVDKVDKREGDFTVYNFKVEGFHSYFVSDLGILVHNADCNEEFIQQIKNSIENSPMMTQQQSVSGGKIQTYVEMMNQGVNMGYIKVDGNIIIDGHHRYIASQIAGVELPQVPGTRPMFQTNQPSYPLKNIEISPLDY